MMEEKRFQMKPALWAATVYILLVFCSASSPSFYASAASSQAKCLHQRQKSKRQSAQRLLTVDFDSSSFTPPPPSEQKDLKEIEGWMNSIPFKNDFDYLAETPQQAAMSRKADIFNGFPGQPKINNYKFAQYSGYVKVDVHHGRALFYYFVEATSDSKNKPLILWLNGGPGCSSFGYGAMEELGPWRVNTDAKSVKFNEYAWNKVANVLFVDSPVGVGFSYSNTSSDYDHLGDTPTVDDNYAFLANWFQRFPEYRNRDFYIAGESYSGHYVPQLAYAVLFHQQRKQGLFINLKGVLVGNGLMDDDADIFGMFNYPWTHGLISDETYNGLIAHCLKSSNSTECENFEDALWREMGNINQYAIHAPVCHESNTSLNAPPSDAPYLIPGYDPCIEDHIAKYLNTREVQLAIHANLTGLPYHWALCNATININWNYTGDSPTTMIPIYQKLMENNLKILIYSGDMDANVPLTSTKFSMKLLNLPIKTPWNAWISDDEVGGYNIDYKGLRFSTIRGAGHEVPLFQPSRMFQLLRSFLEM